MLTAIAAKANYKRIRVNPENNEANAYLWILKGCFKSMILRMNENAIKN